jgi:hypothetical protein
MMPNHYDCEQFAQTHHQDLLREAVHERQLAQLSQPNARMPFFAPLMFSLRTLSIKLRKASSAEQPEKEQCRCTTPP